MGTTRCDVIHKTGSTQRIATPPEEDRATAMRNVHKNLVKIGRVFRRYVRGQTNTQTDTQTRSWQYCALRSNDTSSKKISRVFLLRPAQKRVRCSNCKWESDGGATWIRPVTARGGRYLRVKRDCPGSSYSALETARNCSSSARSSIDIREQSRHHDIMTLSPASRHQPTICALALTTPAKLHYLLSPDYARNETA